MAILRYRGRAFGSEKGVSMKLRTGLFSLAVLALVVPSAWMLIAAPGAPAPEFAGDVRWGSSAALLPDGRMLIVGGADAAGPVSAAEILSNGSVTSAAAMSIARESRCDQLGRRPRSCNWRRHGGRRHSRLSRNL